jgi:lipopolysaccharide export system permease protein
MMTRIDWLILRRLVSRVGITVVILFGMAALAESLNAWKLEHLQSVGGPLLGLSSIVTSAFMWSLNTLPVALLVGAIIALLDLEARRELTVIKASGMSVWRMLRVPLVATILGLGGLAIAADTLTVIAMRSLNLILPGAGAGGELWLEQRAGAHRYVLAAAHPHAGGQVLEDVTFFLPEELQGPRIRAARAELHDGAWHISEGVRFTPDAVPSRIADVEIPTESTAGDLGARLTSPSDLTIFELIRMASLRISDPEARSPVMMRLAKLVVLPFALGAALVIAFAFTTGYRRTNKYGPTALYGIVLGFVVYLVTEMAAIAGSAGILQPAFAAFAPAFVAMIVGTTVLLFREDGRR